MNTKVEVIKYAGSPEVFSVRYQHQEKLGETSVPDITIINARIEDIKAINGININSVEKQNKLDLFLQNIDQISEEELTK